MTYHGGVQGAVDAGGNGDINVDGVSLKIRGGKVVANDGVGTGEYEVGKETDDYVTKFKATSALEVENGKVAGEIEAKTILKISEDTSQVTIYGEKFDVKSTFDADTGELKSFKLLYASGENKGEEADATAIGKAELSTKVDNGVGYITVKQTYTIADDKVTNLGDQNVGHVNLSQGVSVSDAYEHGTRNLTYSNTIALQTGARSKDIVDFTFAYTTSGIGDLTADLDISARGLGTNQLTLVTQEKANAAIDHIDNAINKVSMVRATFGAIQNRLEYKIDNLTTTQTNLQEAESNIRDTDMADEMMSYTKYNILQQAAQSMLAQANQQPQSVLQLLG
ncbi:MAG: flagellin [Oscillospiraceae bacterium]|nr:flagellin [Oscillospiraceae bacterium]